MFNWKNRKILYIVVLTTALVLALTSIAIAQVGTEPKDAAPGTVVTIFGTNDDAGAPGYVSDQVVNIVITGPHDPAYDATNELSTCNAPVTVGADGSWSCTVKLWEDPNWAVGDYTYTATVFAEDGITPLIVETGTFTDDPPHASITVTASPSSAIGGTFSITRVQSNGNTQTSSGPTPQTFGGIQPNSSFSITNIHTPVNGCTYTGPATVNGTAGDANTTTTVTLSYQCGKQDQSTLMVHAPTDMTYGDAAATLTTTGGSGTGAVTYSSGLSTGCSVSGDQLTVTNASGSCAVTATKAADTSYNEATSAPATVTLHKALSTTVVTFEAVRMFIAAQPSRQRLW